MTIRQRFYKLNEELSRDEEEHDYVLPCGLIEDYHERLTELESDAILADDVKLQDEIMDYLINFENFHSM